MMSSEAGVRELMVVVRGGASLGRCSSKSYKLLGCRLQGVEATAPAKASESTTAGINRQRRIERRGDGNREGEGAEFKQWL